MAYLLILSNTIMLVSFMLFFDRLPPLIPLFPSLPWGEDRLGELWMVFLILLAMDLFYFANTVIFSRMFGQNQLMRKILHFANLFVIIGFTFIFFRIIMNVI